MPSFEFSRWDGSQALRHLSATEAFDRLAELVLEHGDYVLRQLEHGDADLVRRLLEDGLLRRDSDGGLSVGPRGLRRTEQQALEELFITPRAGRAGKHLSEFRGTGPVRHDESKPYEFGDPVAHLNLHATLRNALARSGRLHLAEQDLVVHEAEHETSCATVLLLDLSGSMARYGKFYHAKRVALALLALVRSRYPEDHLQVAGFATFAEPLSERGVLRACPKPVNVFDSRVFVRVPLDAPPADVPQHFTNIQAGLRFAREALRRSTAANRQILCVTDGEPTAHLEGRELILTYPPGDRTARATLAEVQACARAGIQLSTFALIEDYFYLGLVNFVDQMAHTGRGRAVYCKAGELGHYVLDSFVRGRRCRRPLG